MFTLIYKGLQVLNFLVVIGLIALWFKPLKEKAQKLGGQLGLLVLVLVTSTLMTSCRRPYKTMILVEIEPNQTAFVVPLSGKTSDQAQYASEEYLENAQVATKRVEIEPVWHQTGHYRWTGEWIPSERVITVDRSPVTREWTQREEKGTSEIDDAFEMESVESIDFSYGGTVSALITEENAAKFLYRFSGKNLETIIDTDIRAFMQGQLAGEFGSLAIKDAQEKKGTIFAQVCENTVTQFEDFGITITACGASGGLIYHDSTIQEAISTNFVTQQEQIRAQAALDAQGIENQRILAEAEAVAEAEIIKGQAQAEVIRLQGEAIADNPAIVSYEIATRSQGQVPSTFLYAGGDQTQLPFAFFLNPEDQEQVVPSE